MSDILIELGGQVFHFVDGDGREQWFPIDAIKRAIYEQKVPLLYLGPMETTTSLEDYREMLRVANDVNPRRAAQLTDEEMEEPALLVRFLAGSSVPIDGSHRLWRAIGEKIDGKRAEVIVALVDHADLQKAGLVLDQNPGLTFINDPRGYDQKAHHRAAMEHYEEHYAKAPRRTS